MMKLEDKQQLNVTNQTQMINNLSVKPISCDLITDILTESFLEVISNAQRYFHRKLDKNTSLCFYSVVVGLSAETVFGSKLVTNKVKQ